MPSWSTGGSFIAPIESHLVNLAGTFEPGTILSNNCYHCLSTGHMPGTLCFSTIFSTYSTSHIHYVCVFMFVYTYHLSGSALFQNNISLLSIPEIPDILQSSTFYIFFQFK